MKKYKKLTKKRIRQLERSDYKYNITFEDGTNRSVIIYSPVPMLYGVLQEVARSITEAIEQDKRLANRSTRKYVSPIFKGGLGVRVEHFGKCGNSIFEIYRIVGIVSVGPRRNPTKKIKKKQMEEKK
jgi:hypothetical protein